jgi:hypothetical protein
MHVAITFRTLQAVNDKYFKEALFRLYCKHLPCLAEQVIGSPAIGEVLKMVSQLVL